MGFSDGKPHICTESESGECIVVMCKTKTHVRYEDKGEA